MLCALVVALSAASCATARAIADCETTTAQHDERADPPRALDDFITIGLRRAAAGIDRFLSNEQSKAEENRSSLSVRVDAMAEEHEPLDVAVRVHARVVLPQTEDKLHLVLGGEPDAAGEGALPIEPNVPVDTESDESRNPGLALQYIAKRTRSNDIRPSIGLRFHDFEPDPYVGVRWRHAASLGAWLARATARVRAYAQAGTETRTTLEFDRGVSKRLLLRSSTRATWRDDEPRRVYGERLTLFQTLGARTLAAYECDAAVESEGDRELVQVTARWRLSRRVAADRLLLEIAPQVAWREADDFVPAAGVFFRIEFDFGRAD